MAPVARREPVEFVEAAVVGVVGALGSVVPFAEGASCVTCLFEDIGQGCFVRIEAAFASADATDARPWMVTPRQEFGSGRRADGADIEVFEGGSSFC